MKTKVLIIDNYDSFTFNLVQLVGNFTKNLVIKRNDKISIDEITELAPDKIIISPGPGRPENAGISPEVIRTLGAEIPILGVCLGHQAIGYVFGAQIVNAPELMHGKISSVQHDNKSIFRHVEKNFSAGRYHSLIINNEDVPEDLEVSAYTHSGDIMGIRHKKYPIEGIQFHPESVLTGSGKKIIHNWLLL